MSTLKSGWLVIVAAVAFGVMWFFRPGGVEVPAPEPVPAEGKGFDYTDWTTVLQAVVAKDGTVDYAALAKERATFDRFLGRLNATSPGSAPHRFKTDDDRLAYYVNAYNAFVIAGVLEHCPLTSVQEAFIQGGFFWRQSFAMGDGRVTLDDLSNDLIRQVFHHQGEIHFILSKGAKGSPPLERTAFTGEDIRVRMKAAADRVARDPRFVRREGDTLHVSELFSWYTRDLGGEPAYSVGKYHPEAAKGSPTVVTVPYDNALNGGCP